MTAFDLGILQITGALHEIEDPNPKNSCSTDLANHVVWWGSHLPII